MKPLRFFAIAWICFCAAALGASEPKLAWPARIGLLADVHITRGTNETQAATHRKHFDQAIAAVNAAQVDLVLIAGDLTENGTPDEMRDFKAQMKSLNAPVWFVPGNHDIGNKILPGKAEKSGLTEWRLARFEMWWGSSFFIREQAGVRVIGMNAPICGSGFRREKKMWNFLEKQLSRPASKPTLLLLHFPPFVKDPNEPGGAYWNLEPFPRQRLLSLVSQGGVKAVLSGHMHKESMARHDGVLFVTSPPVSYGLPRGKQKEGWTLITVAANGDVRSEFRYLDSRK